MKYIKQFNESKTIDDLKNSPFLERSFIIDIFSDIIDCGYSLGFEGYYKHDWLFPGYSGYFNVSKDNYKLKQFELSFYKDLDIDNDEYKSISKMIEELTSFENSIIQYLNQSEFDEDYEFVGLQIKIDGDPNARNLQRVNLKFVNKSIN